MCTKSQFVNLPLSVSTLDGKTHTISIPHQQYAQPTVADLKKAITAQVRNVAVEDMKNVQYNGTLVVEAMGKTLGSYNIAANSLVKLVMQIFVHTDAGNDIPFHVQRSDKVPVLKKQIQDREGVEVKKQVLLYGGNQLSDCSTLGAYGVKEAATIHLRITVV